MRDIDYYAPTCQHCEASQTMVFRNNSYVCTNCGYHESLDPVVNDPIITLITALKRYNVSPDIKSKLDAIHENINTNKYPGLKTLAEDIAKAIDPNYKVSTDSAITLIWTVSDVLSLRPDLTMKDAMEVLSYVKGRYNPNRGVTWTTVKTMADYMFPK